jgi:hypothetical protein
MDLEYENLWISWKHERLTSLIVWDEQYIPRQVIFITYAIKEVVHAWMYAMINGELIKWKIKVSITRTSQPQEVDFHLFCEGKRLIDLSIKKQQTSDTTIDALPKDKNSISLIEELFISDLGMTLLLDHHPRFGFYSPSPNLKKIAKMLRGEQFKILDWLKQKKLISE